MKISFWIILIIFFACSYNKQKKHVYKNFNENAIITDSIKWFFYAYTYQSKVSFKNRDRNVTVNSIECDAVVTKSEYDSSVYLVKCKKEDLEYNHIYEGIMIYGFKYNRGVFIPLTGMVKLDGFDKWEYVKNDNVITGGKFKKFMQENRFDQIHLSQWLKVEAKQKRFY